MAWNLVGYQSIAPESWQHEQGGVYRLNQPFALTTLLYSSKTMLPPVAQEKHVAIPSLLEGEWAAWKGSIYFRPALARTIASYDLAQSVKPSAILVDRASYVVIRNFRMRGYGLDAIQVRGPAEGIRIEDCEISETVRAGISAFNNVKAEIAGCRILESGKAGVLADNFVRLGLEAVSIENSPERLIAGTNSSIDDRGGATVPLAKGPFIRPTGWRSFTAEGSSTIPGEAVDSPR